jgi:hypothetical protein
MGPAAVTTVDRMWLGVDRAFEERRRSAGGSDAERHHRGAGRYGRRRHGRRSDRGEKRCRKPDPHSETIRLA